MKVTGARVTAFASGAPWPRSGCVVEILTDTELTGIAVAPGDLRGPLERATGALLLGTDPRATAAAWERLRAEQALRPRDLGHETIAALDVALWDLKAKAYGEPLWKTLGGSRPRANAYASFDGTESDLKGLTRSTGLRGVRLRASADPGTDLQRLAKAHDAIAGFGAEPVLMLDVARQWPPAETIRRVRDMEERFDLTWVSGAAPSWDFASAREISRAISAAVCIGEGLGVSEMQRHLHERSADVLALDLASVGITGALQLADAAYGFELPVTLCAWPGNVPAHLSGAMPYFESIEIAAPWRPVSSDARIESGRVVVGDAPGNGLSANPARQAGGAPR